MWGTVGLIYNPKYIPDEETTSWDVLKNPDYAGKVLMKDAFRDVYTSLLITLNKEAIDAGADFVGDVDMITKIEKENWFDFDVIIATPEMMPMLGKIGKLLGPKGLMFTVYLEKQVLKKAN